ncbi:MAG: hypothetical protein HUJ76_04085 [Parasporobacterium sp.]|nr:hypothetical protein [Parasporobacterium sp.]
MGDKFSDRTKLKYSGWKKRYAYLDNYKQGMDGKYVYYGRHYILKGDISQLKKLRLMSILTITVLVAMFIAGGCMDAGAIWGKWYVIIPYALELIFIFLLGWKTLSLITEKYPVKEYVYKKTVPWWSFFAITTVVFCGISVCTTIICMLSVPDFVKIPGCIIYIITKLISAAACLVFNAQQKKIEWELDPSEEPEL